MKRLLTWSLKAAASPFALVGAVLAILILTLLLLPNEPAPVRENPVAAALNAPPLRIGLIPERDVMEQQRRFRALCDYLSLRLERPVELVTSRTYDQILSDLKSGEVDAAFLGSLVTTLAVDRMGAELVVKTRLTGGRSTYHGVIFVPDHSDVRSLADLGSGSVAIVRTTTGGNLFLISEMARHGLLSGQGKTARLVWVGTHDDVIEEVVAGQADAGAVKDLRLDEYLSRHPQVKLRRLAESAEVPENTLVVRRGTSPELTKRLRETLLSMDQTDTGRNVLTQFGAQCFAGCTIDEFSAIYEMIDQLQGRWDLVGIPGPPPRRPAGGGKDGASTSAGQAHEGN